MYRQHNLEMLLPQLDPNQRFILFILLAWAITATIKGRADCKQ
jgi:hypothetical protein